MKTTEEKENGNEQKDNFKQKFEVLSEEKINALDKIITHIINSSNL